MNYYEDAYKILSDACITFCEIHDNTFDDIVAKIHTDVLGDDIIYCVCGHDKFNFIHDFYEGGKITIIALDYFNDVAERGFAK